MCKWLSRYRFSAIDLGSISAGVAMIRDGHWIVALVICAAGALAQAIAESGVR